MRISKQSGFGTIEIVIIFLAVALLGVLGWMAYDNYRSLGSTNSGSENNQAKDSDTQTEDTKETSDPTAGWTAYIGSDNKISFKYPKGWVTAERPELCSDGIVLLAPSVDTVGLCATEYFGQVSVIWKASSQTCEDYGESNTITYDNGTVETISKDNTKEVVTVSGVTGIKRTSISTGNGPYNSPEGTYSMSYCFTSGGYFYVVQYAERPTFPNVRQDFEMLVQKTLKFGN